MQRYKGVVYPLNKHPQGFFHNASSDIEQIKSDMATIILTEPGERIFEPFFGVAFSKLNLNQPVEMVRDQARIMIATALKRWEKRVQVQDIGVDLTKIEGSLVIKVHVLFIDPIDIRNTQELVVYKSLGDLNGRALPF